MQFSLEDISTYSIIIPVLISLFKLGQMNKDFFPFFLFIWTGLIAELVSRWTISQFHSNAVASNIYVLLESIIVTWQFKRWGLFEKANNLFWFLVISFALFWVIEIVLLTSIKGFSSYFRITYSFIIVLMSISMINRLIVREQNSLLLNPAFLACIAFISFFTCKLLIEIFWVYGLNGSKEFRASVFGIVMYINLFANLIYVLTVLWVPRKQEYILL